MKQELETAGQTLWEDLEGTLSGTAAGSADVFSPDFCDLRAELRREQSEPLDEVVQHLRDLGYLKSRLDEDKNEVVLGPDDEPKLAAALGAYYADQDRFESLFSYRLSPGESGAPRNVFRDAVLEERLKQPLVVKFDTIARLRALTSLDGKVEFLAEPEMHETSLRTRVLHHLLRVYGVLPGTFDAAAAYGERSLRALRGLRSLRGVRADEAPLLHVMNGLNRFDVVAEVFASQFENSSVRIPAPKSAKDWTASLKLQRKALRESRLPARVVEVRAFDEEKGADWPPPNWNLFGVRLLQVYLWHRGHYFGEIDGLWGEVSQAAFLSALTAHDLPVKPLKNWWDRSAGGCWMEWDGFYCVDVSAFVRACQSASAPAAAGAASPDEIFDMQEAIDDRLTKLGATDAERQKAWSEVFDAAAGDPDWKRKRRRRNFSLGMVGRGIRRMFDLMAQAWEKLKDFVRAVVEKITGAVRQAFRFLQRSLGPALHTARLAARRVIRMVTGAPFVMAVSQTRWVVTKFSFDQDAVVLGGPGLQGEDVDAHFAMIREENRALDVVFRLGVKVLEIASLFLPPVTGFKAITLAWKALRAVWDLFRELQSPFTKEPAPWRTGMLMAT